ncbi:IclR family transcriptional regulator C-terminal domain-containing protein [Streptomyces sp. NPDC005921]|uniref:IclR family transcriptional regulator domain-containing protein n=1 Tax=Streptomyces sp. NPDC005827 TaxID=3157070 RepID=UPI0033DE5A33
MADGELESGLRSIAVQVRDRAGRPVAALNVAAHVARRTLAENVTDVPPALHTTATQVQDDLHIASGFAHVPLSRAA